MRWRADLGADDHDDRFHGRVHPRQLHGRHDRNVLHAIRTDDGRRRRHLAAQCHDAQPGALRAHPAAPRRCRERGDAGFLRPIPCGFRPFVPPRTAEIPAGRVLFVPPQGNRRREHRRGVRRAGLADEHYQNGPRAAGGHGHDQRGRADIARQQSGRDRPHHGRNRSGHPRHSANPDLFARYGQGHPAQPVVVGRIVFPSG